MAERGIFIDSEHFGQSGRVSVPAYEVLPPTHFVLRRTSRRADRRKGDTLQIERAA